MAPYPPVRNQQQTVKIDDLNRTPAYVQPMYLRRYVLPAFEEYIAPWRMVQKAEYLRGMMLYWGAVIER